MEDQAEHIDDDLLPVKAVAIKQEPGASPEPGTPGCGSSNGSQYGGVPPSWMDDFPWLEFVDGEHGGVCRVCTDTGQDGRLPSTEHHDLLSHVWNIGHQEAEALKEQEALRAVAAKPRRRSAPTKTKRYTSSHSKPKGSTFRTSTRASYPSAKPESKSHHYEQNYRVRKFCNHWLTIYKWLQYDVQKNIMYCKYCKQQNIGNNSFVQGSRCFKRDTLRAHDLCKEHMLAVNAESLATAISDKKASSLTPQPVLSKKTRFLLHKILKYFPWLLYNSETQVLICDTCQRHGINTLYMDCTQGLDHKIIQQHLECKRHQTAMDAEFSSWHVMYNMTASEEELEFEEISVSATDELTSEVFVNGASGVNEPLEVTLSSSVPYNTLDSPMNDEVLPVEPEKCLDEGDTEPPLAEPDTNNAQETDMVIDSNTVVVSNNDICQYSKPRMSQGSRFLSITKNNVKGKIQPTFGSFKPEWRREFAWLRYDKEQNVMVCMLCSKHKKKNTFVRGIRVFLRSFITHHMKSVKHRKALEEEAAQDPESHLLQIPQPREPLGCLPNSTHQLPLASRVSSTEAGVIVDDPEDTFGIDSLSPDVNDWHTALNAQQQAVSDLTGRCHKIINSVLDSAEHSRTDLITIDNLSQDFPSDYADHLQTNGPCIDEGITGGIVILERKKDGTVYRRVRKFRPHWLKDFPWLLYSRSEDVMRCAVCMKHQRNSAFTKGTRTFHLDNIRKHEGSSNHQRAMGIEMM